MVVLRSISAASCVVDPNIWLQEGGGGTGTSSVSMQEGSVFKSSSEEMLQAPLRPNQHHPASAAAPQHQHQQHHHLLDRRLKPNVEVAPKCPRCDSSNTKFCYYNNYSLSQPRYFCKTCRRYWTKGGSLRNVPVGGGCRKNKRTKRATESHQQQQQQQQRSQNPNSSEPTSSNSTSTSNNNSSVSNSSKKTSGDLNLCSPAPPSLDQLNLSSVYFSLLRQDGTDSLPAFTAFGAAAGADPSCSLMAGMAGLEALPPSELAPLPNLPNLAALQALKGATGLLSELDSTAATLTQRSSCSGGSTSRSCMSKSETATTALAAAAADLSPIYDTHVSTSAPMSQVGDAFNEAAHQQIAAAAAAAAESSCGDLPWHQNHPENHSSHRLSIPLLMEDHDPNHHQQQPPLIMPSAFMHRDKHHNNSGSSASDLNFRHMFMSSVQASAGNWQLPSLSENLLDTAAVVPPATNNTLGTSFNWNVSVPTWPDFSAFAPSSFSNPLI